MVKVYHNQQLVLKVDVSSWPHYANGGFIGLAMESGNRLDDYGGGGLSQPLSLWGELGESIDEAFAWPGNLFGGEVEEEKGETGGAGLASRSKHGRNAPEGDMLGGQEARPALNQRNHGLLTLQVSRMDCFRRWCLQRFHPQYFDWF